MDISDERNVVKIHFFITRQARYRSNSSLFVMVDLYKQALFISYTGEILWRSGNVFCCIFQAYSLSRNYYCYWTFCLWFSLFLQTIEQLVYLTRLVTSERRLDNASDFGSKLRSVCFILRGIWFLWWSNGYNLEHSSCNMRGSRQSSLSIWLLADDCIRDVTNWTSNIRWDKWLFLLLSLPPPPTPAIS